MDKLLAIRMSADSVKWTFVPLNCGADTAGVKARSPDWRLVSMKRLVLIVDGDETSISKPFQQQCQLSCERAE